MGPFFAGPGFGYCKTQVCLLQTLGLKQAKSHSKRAKMVRFLHKKAGCVQQSLASFSLNTMIYNSLRKNAENRVFAYRIFFVSKYAILVRGIVSFFFKS